MFNPSLDVEIIEYTVSQKGRLIILEAQIDNTTYVFVNIYAQNVLAQQVNFFNNLKCKLSRYVNEILLLEVILIIFIALLHQVIKAKAAPLGKKAQSSNLFLISVEP